MKPEIGDIKICRKYSIIPRLVFVGITGETTKWIWFQEFYAVYEYGSWNDWEVGDDWINSWKLKRQFVLW